MNKSNFVPQPRKRGFRTPSGIICLVIIFLLFGYLGYQMGTANMLNTVMNTAHDLLLNTVFYLMAICVITGALGRIFVEFGVVKLFEKLLRPLMKPLFNLPGVASLGAVVTFLSDNPAIISLAQDKQFASYFKKYQYISLTNFGTSFGMGLLVIVFMVSMGFTFEPFVGFFGAMIGCVVSTRLMQRSVIKAYPHYKHEPAVVEQKVDEEDEIVEYKKPMFQRILDSLLDGGRTGVDVGIAIIPGVLIISTLVMILTFGPSASGEYTGAAYEGTALLPHLAGKVSGVFEWLFGFDDPHLIAFPITALGAVGAALGLVPGFMESGWIDGNAIAVFTAIGMCWSGYLSTHTAMLDTLGYRSLTSKAIIAHTIGGLVAAISAHWLYMLVMLFVGTPQGESAELVVSNTSQIVRVDEMVEVDISRLNLKEGEGYVVRNAAGEEIPSQLTYDGKLIFQSSVDAESKVTYTVEVGKPSDYQTYACGRVYPERVDDVAWESDLIAYRAYGPALQQSGERAFGYDVWVKNNTDLPVVEARYAKELDPETKGNIATLRATGHSEAADALYAMVSYHNDHGNGFDAYKVGPTLGGGATAIIDNGSIVYPYCYKEYEILDNGPLRFTVRLTYHPTVIDGEALTEVRTISIDKGSFLNRTEVVFKGDAGEKEIDLMSGIVLHESDIRAEYDAENYYVTYAEVVEAPDGGELYQAMFFPGGWSGAENRLWNQQDDKPAGTYGHAAAYNIVNVGEPLNYYWGALWSKSTQVTVGDKEAFDALMADVVAQKQSPLKVTIKTE